MRLTSCVQDIGGGDYLAVASQAGEDSASYYEEKMNRDKRQLLTCVFVRWHRASVALTGLRA